MCERALPVGPVTRDTSGDRNQVSVAVLIESLGLLGLTLVGYAWRVVTWKPRAER